MATRHTLRLVAPWYRWARQREDGGTGLGPLPRATRPVFLKYTSIAQAVKLVLEDPQRNYVFHPEDQVTVTVGSPYSGPIRLLADRRVLVTPLRKLYRDTHDRGYLVACEMHCDAPGFPDPSWGHVGEMGFVVRRWVPRDPAGFEARAEALAADVGWLRALELRLLGAVLLVLDPENDPNAPEWIQELIEELEEEPEVERKLASVRAAIDSRQQERVMMEIPEPAGWKRQLWRPDGEHEHVGAWIDLADDVAEPATLEALAATGEKVYPLYRLIPDPDAESHSSHGARLLFGAVPSGDMETTETGESHLDSRDRYEIRCFVHQLRDCCTGRPERGHCPSYLRWSQPTEPYGIAPHFDPVGTGNLSVRIEMPDLREVAAQPGTGFPLRFEWPKLSKPGITGLIPPGGATLPGPMLCTTSIPLVTIVATFLLEIFTPIVVYLFSLYPLLLQRICFPFGGAIPAFPAFEGATVEGAVSAEYQGQDRIDFDARFAGLSVPSRTGRLEWEPVETERPKVDDARLLGVVA